MDDNNMQSRSICYNRRILPILRRHKWHSHRRFVHAFKMVHKTGQWTVGSIRNQLPREFHHFQRCQVHWTSLEENMSVFDWNIQLDVTTRVIYHISLLINKKYLLICLFIKGYWLGDQIKVIQQIMMNSLIHLM